MQITDINDFISTAAQLLNAPDLILIAVLLANVWLGARRGLVGALYGVIGRIGMIAASVAAAKYTAPYVAQWAVRVIQTAIPTAIMADRAQRILITLFRFITVASHHKRG